MLAGGDLLCSAGCTDCGSALLLAALQKSVARLLTESHALWENTKGGSLPFSAELLLSIAPLPTPSSQAAVNLPGCLSNSLVTEAVGGRVCSSVFLPGLGKMATRSRQLCATWLATKQYLSSSSPCPTECHCFVTPPLQISV